MDASRQTGSDKPSLRDGGRIAIIAGSGQLPVILARHLKVAGTQPLVVLIHGEANDALKTFDHIEIPLEHAATLPSKLKKAGVTRLVLAGGISRRPSLWSLRPSMALFKFIFRAVEAFSRGDDNLFRMAIKVAESEGITLVGAQEVVPDILTKPGLLSRKKPSKTDNNDVQTARSALRLIGPLDLGQAIVSINGRVVAIEGPEGTDATLRRVCDLRASGRLPAKAGGVLAKCAKPGQELRVDLPTIGPDTIANAAAARLRGIAVEAGRSIILERERTIAAADAAGLFVIGIEAD